MHPVSIRSDSPYGDHAPCGLSIRRLLRWATSSPFLETSDIVVEQKMAARLTRAEWYAAMNERALASVDIEQIIHSHRNFAGVVGEAERFVSTTPLHLVLEVPTLEGGR